MQSELHGHISMRQVRFGLILTLVGLFVFLLGARPSLFGMDRSPVIGFVQLAVMLVGLAIICLGGYICLAALWNSTPRSIAADVGLRLVSTGYVIAVFAGMADIFGFGSHRYPNLLPYFGPLQALGVEVGEFIIAIGFILLMPIWRRRK
ncbi:MAG: hypothetical protein PHQ40_12440 [Anaerolineaceae bacterium]|nr:hypothetical protein [Anaerolineaceae bacterium]